MAATPIHGAKKAIENKRKTGRNFAIFPTENYCAKHLCIFASEKTHVA
jgi:hypothetical protein